LQLGALPFGRPAGDRAGAQRLQAALAVFGHPGEHGGAGQAQGLGDGLGVGARLDLLDGPDAELLQGGVVEFAAVVVSHTGMHAQDRPAVQLLTIPLVTPLLT
jgi:hypothetical protein